MRFRIQGTICRQNDFALHQVELFLIISVQAMGPTFFVCQSAFFVLRGEELPRTILTASSGTRAMTPKSITRGNFRTQFAKTPSLLMRQNTL